MAKNTAPAIAAAVEYLLQSVKEDGIVVVVPSDHLIADNETFRDTKGGGDLLPSYVSDWP
jgi:mannose-1-phosphate guanylyltransferase